MQTQPTTSAGISYCNSSQYTPVLLVSSSKPLTNITKFGNQSGCGVGNFSTFEKHSNNATDSSQLDMGKNKECKKIIKCSFTYNFFN